MTKYYLLGAAEALLLSIPVPATLLLLALLLPVGWAFAGAGVLAGALLWLVTKQNRQTSK